MILRQNGGAQLILGRPLGDCQREYSAVPGAALYLIAEQEFRHGKIATKSRNPVRRH
jgi:hypothetical protein